jgi:hypothetical protein
MGGISESSRSEAQLDESGDYPTLKLSSAPSGSEARKDNTKLEKTATPSGIAIVKPERAKKAPMKGTTPPLNGVGNQESPSSERSSKDTLSKFQKFGVRVLPDSNAGHVSSHCGHEQAAGSKQSGNIDYPPEQATKRSEIEAEHRQNEQNSMIEKVSEGATAQLPSSNSQSNQMRTVPTSTSEVDGVGRKPKPKSCFYDERGIDVGPIEQQRSHPKQSFMGHQPEEGKQSGDTHGESNVKNLLTKGLQNLKDKLHHNDKKKIGSQNPETSGSSEQELQDCTGQVVLPQLREVIKIEASSKSGKEKEGTPQPHESRQDMQQGEIPTEIPEEVCRAAMAARSNRKSLGNVVVETEVEERKRTMSQHGVSGDSSSEDESSTVPDSMDSDSLGRMPKRPNKRKAPPPPPEEREEKTASAGQSPHLGSDRDSEGENLSSVSDKQKIKDSTAQHSSKRHKDVEHIQMADDILTLPFMGKNITSFADIARQRNNTDVLEREVTNITVEGNSNQPLRTGTTTFGASVTVDQSTDGSPERDESVTQEPKPQQQHLDYDIGVNVSSINSESDSDLEQLDADDSYDAIVKRKKTKKGGTTIELNSSHITIHHSPSSDTVQLDNESTRKAASLGDLSRLDSEQPMSILERAVSLDLADGGTPHSSKKRKAPLPPPGEDYLSGMPEADDGMAHRKEPRLDTAMDTFQRRRLKKSSDWGTLEEALLQSDSKGVDFHTSKSNEPTEEETSHLQSEVTVSRSTAVEQFPISDRKKDIDTATALTTSTDTHPGTTRTDILDILNVDGIGHSALSEYGTSEAESLEQMENENLQHQQKTVLCITPEPVGESNFSSSASQITIASGTFSSVPTCHDTSIVSGEVTSMPRQQVFNTNPTGPVQSGVSALSSPQQPGSGPVLGLVSSTPISHSGAAYSVTALHTRDESVQSPVVTSSHAGISSVHVVSSTTHDASEPHSVLASITEPFVTAVDSTTTLGGEISKDDDHEDIVWGQDLQPPELPTSPVPVLSQLSSYKPSPSMTYITEIQVVTSADSSNSDLMAESTPQDQQITPAEISSSTVTQRVVKYRSDSSLSTDSFTSEGDDKEADIAHSIVVPQKGNVTVTAIRNTVSRIPMRITTDRIPPVNSANRNANHISNVEEQRAKPARPPVPPRKSDNTASSTVSEEGGGSGRVLNNIQQPPVESIHIGPRAGGSTGSKFISFSSLTPQVTTSTENNTDRNSTSFEQWVFLDEGSTHNGLEEASNADDGTGAPHSMVVSLPARTQSVTHIVLDNKQSTRSNGNP